MLIIGEALYVKRIEKKKNQTEPQWLLKGKNGTEEQTLKEISEK